MSTTPAHSTIIRGAIERAIANMAGGMPGRVERYDASKQRADIQPLIMDGSIDPDTDDRVARLLPVITDVPILMLGTSRARATIDIRTGDTVWILSASRSLDVYLIQGGEVDPQDDRRHHISDAVALPAVFDFAHVPGDASTNGTIIHATKLRLGAPDASDPVARKSDVDNLVSQINTLRTALNTHVHATAGTGPPVAPTVGIGGIPVSTVTSPACSPVVSSK